MKKIIVAVLMAVSMLAVLGCKKQKAEVEDPVAELKGRGVFVIGLDDSFPPLGFRNDDNEIVGFDIDLAKEVASRMEVAFKAQPIDWDAKEMELETGKIDCIWNGFTITEDRKAALSFTDAYLNNAQVVVVRNDSGLNSLADLSGKKIGLQRGSSAQEAVDGNPTFASSLAEVVMFRDNITALNDLDIGGVDGVVMDSVVANYSIAQTKKPFYVISEALSNEAYGIGFRKTEPKLRDEVYNILREMKEDGTVTAISTKWFGKDITVIQ
ncbi:MAG: amino acid ABC transporter substrate-binding protein [Treponema sp.]|nr:amino acid ABC transporter substrate-binding protein [Treponema sp.]